MNHNLYAMLRAGFIGHPDRPCLIEASDTLTYGALDELSGRFASALAAIGIGPGDRLVAQVEKSPGAVALYLATLRLGAVYIPLNTAYTPAEIGYFVADAEPALFVSTPDRLPALEKVVAGVAIKTLGGDAGTGLWRDALLCPVATEIAARNPDDLAAILYTSGTTGRSKGAMLSHGNLATNAQSLHRIWGFENGEVLLHALPIFHVHGLFVGLHLALLNASPMIFLREFNAAAVRREVRRASVLMGVPTHYARLLAEPGFGAEDCADVRLFVSGSAPMTPQLHEAFTRATGHRILERYGMTEAGMIASNPYHGDRVPGSVGFALPEVEIRIADPDGNLLPPGATGMVEIRGPNLFQGYWRMPERQASDFRRDGFFITGDVGMLDTDGRLWLSGRAGDLIISGGYNIYPKEIELILDTVRGVGESAVVGVPHPDLGEGVIAVLAGCDPRLDDMALRAAMADRLARFKHPRRFFRVDALPRNAMGKVQKKALRETFANAYTNDLARP